MPRSSTETTGKARIPALQRGDASQVNYPDIDLSDPRWNTSGTPWHDLYYKAGYARLQQVKRMYDPGDVFRHAQSVRLPEAGLRRGAPRSPDAPVNSGPRGAVSISGSTGGRHRRRPPATRGARP
ncbi:hypothetical protein GCM10009802_10410 [Streptomyces synnematoformans]|uniref:Berberine/berberine-like domain-containing protein n=1 Tax=Streptomyces synnematoformans TaxID=415721 RepID=A0ABP5J7B5_9ACTN